MDTSTPQQWAEAIVTTDQLNAIADAHEDAQAHIAETGRHPQPCGRLATHTDNCLDDWFPFIDFDPSTPSVPDAFRILRP